MNTAIKKTPVATGSKEKQVTDIVAEKPPKVNRLQTIKIGNNIDYAKVSARVAEFNKTNANGSIVTDYEFKEGWVIFKATIIPDVEKDRRVFKGTSMGKVGAVKAFEKLETIAVGRALAFAGLLSDGEIASSEEMQSYGEAVVEFNVEETVAKLNKAKDFEELKKIWLGLTQAERDNKEVETVKNRIKDIYYEDSSSGAEEPGVAPTPKRESNGNGTQKTLGV